MGKKVTTVLHQVVADFSNLSGHLGWKKTSLKVSIYNIILQVFLKFLVSSSEKVVVLEGMIKERLVEMVGFEDKIEVIPHGIYRQTEVPSQITARKSLNIKRNELVLLYFGYLTWYKGVDFLIKSLADVREIKGRKIRLIVAGGDSVTQKTKTHYRQFADSVYKLAKNCSQITITGFVPEKKIATYFSASDLVILPYRAMISSSGPLSFAAGFNKPCILSDQLEGYLKSPDFYDALQASGLEKKDLFFALSKEKLIEKIESVITPKKIASLLQFASLLNEKRDFRSLASKYAKVINHNPQELASFMPSVVSLTQ
jgi:glycosyltransferase involved in cell wall biosynthesis